MSRITTAMAWEELGLSRRFVPWPAPLLPALGFRATSRLCLVPDVDTRTVQVFGKATKKGTDRCEQQIQAPSAWWSWFEHPAVMLQIGPAPIWILDGSQGNKSTMEHGHMWIGTQEHIDCVLPHLKMFPRITTEVQQAAAVELQEWCTKHSPRVFAKCHKPSCTEQHWIDTPAALTSWLEHLSRHGDAWGNVSRFIPDYLCLPIMTWHDHGEKRFELWQLPWGQVKRPSSELAVPTTETSSP